MATAPKIPPGRKRVIERVRQTKQTERGRKQDDRLSAGTHGTATGPQSDLHKKWRKNPNRVDLDEVDRPESIVNPPPPKEKPKPTGKKPRRRKIFVKPEDFRRPEPDSKPRKAVAKSVPHYKIIGGSQADRDRVDRIIRENFTKAEVAQTKGLVIEIGTGRLAGSGGHAGFYIWNAGKMGFWPRDVSKRARKHAPVHYLKLGKEFTHGDVITHEFTHHIRAMRFERSVGGKVTRRPDNLFRDRDVEEAATDLETVGRHNPFTKRHSGAVGRPDNAGYYQYVAAKPRTGGTFERFDEHNRRIEQATLHDRALITLTSDPGKAEKLARDKSPKLKESGKQGLPLLNSIESRFPDTKIGQLKRATGRQAKGSNIIQGEAEQLDEYFAVVDDNGEVISRIHSRDGKKVNSDRKAVQASFAPGLPKGQQLVQYHDGKKTVIARGRAVNRLGR